MLGTPERQNRILFAVAVAAAGLIHVSIAASQIFLGLGLALLLLFRGKMNFPRVWIPLAAFFFWTALADVLSPDPWGGRAQLKKFFVFFFVPLLYSVFAPQFAKAYYLLVAWTVAATASGLWGLGQFLWKYLQAKRTGENFYVTYVGHRITGFESHWMTFGALQLSVLSLLLAHWFFSDQRMPRWVYGSIFVLSAAILLGETRSIWLATACAVLYLVWFWRPKMTLALPIIAIVAFALAPATTRERLRSVLDPHGETDSNRHRYVTFWTGVEMVKAHPWFGLGPEQIRRQFDAYVPTSIKRPLPVGYYGHLHNIYVQYAAERGIPGLLLLLWVIGMTAFDCLRALSQMNKERSQERFWLHGTLAVIVGVLVGGLFEYNLGDSEVLMMFTSVVALGYAAVKNGSASAKLEQIAA